MSKQYTQELMIRLASGYQYALCDPEETDSCFEPNLGQWEYHESMNISSLGEQYFGSPSSALQWLKDEIQVHHEDGLEFRVSDFKSMLEDGVKDPIILGNSDRDGLALWDGTHRLAAAYAKGRPCPAIVGTKIN